MVDAVHADNALAGVHCCGNTEWSILIDAGVDIVNFDAFGYGETIAMYPAGIKTLFARGGCSPGEWSRRPRPSGSNRWQV